MKFLLISLFLGLLMLTGCQRNSNIIEPDEAKTMLASDNSIVLLDVRTQEEYDEEHIAGSVLIPLHTLEQTLKSSYPELDTTFIIYCRSGNRSADALDIMQAMGYENVYDLGGIQDWPYETISH